MTTLVTETPLETCEAEHAPLAESVSTIPECQASTLSPLPATDLSAARSPSPIFTGVVVSTWSSVEQSSEKESAVHAMMHDDTWGAHEQPAGERMLIERSPEGIRGINSNGYQCELPRFLVDSVAELPNVVLDGFLDGEVFAICDILALEGTDVRPLSYSRRVWLLNELNSTLPNNLPEGLFLVQLSRTTSQKLAFMGHAKKSRLDGIVLRNMQAPYPRTSDNDIHTGVYLSLSESAEK
ncbi:hypothetical protein LC612_43035 [Nostoc sp. CHAB 5834]|nr:hypothetical protein [Nostoc sp. CHAB 5834]